MNVSTVTIAAAQYSSFYVSTVLAFKILFLFINSYKYEMNAVIIMIIITI